GQYYEVVSRATRKILAARGHEGDSGPRSSAARPAFGAFAPRATSTTGPRRAGQRVRPPPALSSLALRARALEDAPLLPPRGERSDGALEVLRLVPGRQLDTDPRLSLGHDREREADHVDALLEKAPRHVVGQALVVEHDRHDRVFAHRDLESGRVHRRTEPL